MSTAAPFDATAFGRAFVATQYLLGRRNEELGVPEDLPPAAREACASLLRQLCHSDRDVRARVLAAELAKIAQALDRRGLS